MVVSVPGTQFYFLGLKKSGSPLGVFRCMKCRKLVHLKVYHVSHSSMWACARCVQHPHTKMSQNLDRELLNQWHYMRARCRKGYAPVCFAWQVSFEEYQRYVRVIPYYGVKGYTLDRIDPFGGYTPGNVQWVPRWWQDINTKANQQELVFKPIPEQVRREQR